MYQATIIIMMGVGTRLINVPSNNIMMGVGTRLINVPSNNIMMVWGQG